MTETPRKIDGEIDVENFSPYKLVENFNKSRIVSCLILAAIVHVVVIGGTSVGYIYSTWINPQDPSAQVAGKKPTTTRPTTEPATQAGDKKGAKPRRKPGQSPVVKRITDKPKPGETPKAPTGLGIDIDGTNKK